MANTSPTAVFSASPDQHAASSAARHDESFASHILPPLADAAASPRPASENEKHPKGKRKRTAAKDKMILEEAYSNNAKPDKQARLEIVQRVSLNEKEVQIWFQNRRQNDRRKSRPLSAQEIAALRYGGMHVISSDPITNMTPSKIDKSFPASDPASSRTTDPINASPRPLLQTPSISRSHSDLIASTPIPMSNDGIPRSHLDITPKHDSLSPSQESQDGSHSLSSSMSSSVGYLANRWNLGSSFSTPPTLGRGGDDSFRLEPFPPSSCSSELSQFSSQSQSKVRLSLSLEGKAELVSNQISPTRNLPPRSSSTTPSLPHVRQRSLQRSHSALPSITLPPISTLTNSLPPRLMRGRSRDVHAWESCADAENRDELTAQAEHESNGSAIAAISLLRSSSGVLQPSGAKRNAPTSKPQRPHQVKKARLSRSDSSVTRFETEEDETEKPEKEFGKVKVSMLVSPSGDSDKENWSPDEEGNPRESHRRQPLPPAPPKALNSRRPGRVLQEQKRPNLLGNRSNTAPARHRNVVKEGVEIFEDVMKLPAVSREDDVERFMRGGEVSPSKKPDMDCVAGLLSLSQGAWR
ncbi:hypothetical protein B0J13DRAFT_538300 [Dactylonectria estremocensis]|uniref:Homeobox domain-containing protein n=1 Tax=Dactylonectria estremocensis TaxID=1079267 RepID=A0A9P9FLM6_9HYPO|nr:hypothetical protein B0J13DRAFT_538300 [Dactylonectria estremocensis]